MATIKAVPKDYTVTLNGVELHAIRSALGFVLNEMADARGVYCGHTKRQFETLQQDLYTQSE